MEVGFEPTPGNPDSEAQCAKRMLEPSALDRSAIPPCFIWPSIWTMIKMGYRFFVWHICRKCALFFQNQWRVRKKKSNEMVLTLFLSQRPVRLFCMIKAAGVIDFRAGRLRLWKVPKSSGFPLGKDSITLHFWVFQIFGCCRLKNL